MNIIRRIFESSDFIFQITETLLTDILATLYQTVANIGRERLLILRSISVEIREV